MCSPLRSSSGYAHAFALCWCIVFCVCRIIHVLSSVAYVTPSKHECLRRTPTLRCFHMRMQITSLTAVFNEARILPQFAHTIPCVSCFRLASSSETPSSSRSSWMGSLFGMFGLKSGEARPATAHARAADNSSTNKHKIKAKSPEKGQEKKKEEKEKEKQSAKDRPDSSSTSSSQRPRALVSNGRCGTILIRMCHCFVFTPFLDSSMCLRRAFVVSFIHRCRSQERFSIAMIFPFCSASYAHWLLPRRQMLLYPRCCC